MITRRTPVAIHAFPRLSRRASYRIAMSIDIVCRGWELLVDGAELYPDDLPPEWRLTYFSNVFDAVYLPAEDWVDQTEATLSEWHDDVHSGFRFFLESPAAPTETGRTIGRARRALGDRLAGLVCEAGPSSGRHAEEPGCWYRPADAEALAGAQTGSAAHGEALALHIPASPDAHPRGIRQHLEALRRHCGPVPLLLVLEPPCAGTVLRWRTIAELLGWP
jgi:hypothetical protein